MPDNIEQGDDIIYWDDSGKKHSGTVHKMNVRGEYSVEVEVDGKTIRDYSNRLGCILFIGGKLIFAPYGLGEKGCFGPK
jgi:hypothetical protein